MSHVSDQSMASWLTDAHVIASVGLTSDPETKEYRVAAYQQSQGYQVIPVNQTGDVVLGHPAVQQVSDIGGPVDIVNVSGRVKDVKTVADQAIRAGAKVLWIEPGAVDPAATKQARDSGMHVVMNKRFENEHRRLLSSRPQ